MVNKTVFLKNEEKQMRIFIMYKYFYKVILTLFLCFLINNLTHAENINSSKNHSLNKTYINNISTDITKILSGIYVSTMPIHIIYPPEEKHLPYVESSFVFGWAVPNSTLTINGVDVPIHPEGGFLTMLDYTPGPFTITAELLLNNTCYSEVRNIFITPPDDPLPASPVTIDYIKPQYDMSFQTGDIIQILCKGSPGSQAFFTIKGIKGKFPIGESNFDVSGIYKGIYKIKDNDELKNSRIKVTLINKKLKKKVSKYAKGKISRFNNNIPYSVEVSTDNAVIKAGPRLAINNNAGYMLFPYIGTKLKVIGEIGNEYKIYLNSKREGWIDKDKVSPLPLGTAIHDCIAENVLIGINDYNNTIVRINLDEKVPYEVKTGINGEVIDISLFGVISDTSWVKYSTTSTIVNQTQWFQDDTDTYRLRVYTPKNSWWGYDARYEETDFVLELCSPPKLKSTHILEGVRVAVDAGHCPDTGAIGPTGLLEKDINWIIAQKLKKLLIQEKAEVIMIRKGLDEAVRLYERPRRAWKARADILISVHNNALPDGKDPFEENGYGVYYFHPHSYNLAEEILKAYDEVIGENSTSLYSLRNDGLHYGNLALVRPSQMPAVLTESVYMMVPEEEALLKTEDFQSACAKAMLLGLKRYMKKMRK